MKRVLPALMSLYLLCGAMISPRAQTTSKEKIAKQTMQYASQGSGAYLKRDYKKAIEFYSKALELEKEAPTLDQTVWRVVVDNLGLSYGLSGDNKKAKEIFEYGLSRDDKYPMFYYNLACAYAEMNDPDNAITNLKRAFEFSENMMPGERIPDPATDDSFTRFQGNEKFRRALEELKAAKPAALILTVPKAPWRLTFPGQSLTPVTQQVKPDGKNGYFVLIDNTNKMTISAFIEPAAKCKTSKDCRDWVWKLGNPEWKNPKNLVLSEVGEISYFEFLLPEIAGIPIRQQNMYAEYVVGNYWVTRLEG
jgi:tetratricopeptide (TPR) repeat protein